MTELWRFFIKEKVDLLKINVTLSVCGREIKRKRERKKERVREGENCVTHRLERKNATFPKTEIL